MVKQIDFSNAQNNSWKLVDADHPIKLYYGKDDKGRYAIEYIGSFKRDKKIQSSAIIDITHYKVGDNTSVVFSLNDSKYLENFSIFCLELIKATSVLSKDSSRGYRAICAKFFEWQRMFKSQSEILEEKNIKGLIGELLFLKDVMIPKYGVEIALSSWVGTAMARKDFSVENTWYEIKTIDFGKNSVEISSVEQLDSPNVGHLVVYQLESMGGEYKGITLNSVVKEIYGIINYIEDKATFDEKLEKAKYFPNPLYDEYVYEKRDVSTYRVTKDFPRLEREKLPTAIGKVKFELILTEILPYKI